MVLHTLAFCINCPTRTRKFVPSSLCPLLFYSVPSFYDPSTLWCPKHTRIVLSSLCPPLFSSVPSFYGPIWGVGRQVIHHARWPFQFPCHLDCHICCIFTCPNSGIGLSVLSIFMCTQVLMHAIAQMQKVGQVLLVELAPAAVISNWG